jgi:hypothetical protein
MPKRFFRVHVDVPKEDVGDKRMRGWSCASSGDRREAAISNVYLKASLRRRRSVHAEFCVVIESFHTWQLSKYTCASVKHYSNATSRVLSQSRENAMLINNPDTMCLSMLLQISKQSCYYLWHWRHYVDFAIVFVSLLYTNYMWYYDVLNLITIKVTNFYSPSIGPRTMLLLYHIC